MLSTKTQRRESAASRRKIEGGDICLKEMSLLPGCCYGQHGVGGVSGEGGESACTSVKTSTSVKTCVQHTHLLREREGQSDRDGEGVRVQGLGF